MKRLYIATFGCQMNVHDSERIVDLLRPHGYEPTADAAGADLVVINTCSVREKAEDKLYGALGSLRLAKQRRPELVVAVAGCVAQQAGEALLDRAPHVDLVLGPDAYAALPHAIDRIEAGGPPEALVEFDVASPAFLMAGAARSERPSAYVTVMKGCDERCTFCIVPLTRGPERCRPVEEILEEARRWVDAGAREIVLLGQTVNSYHGPGGALEFAELLSRLDEIPALSRLRYTSPHPRFFTPELIAAHGGLRTLCEHVHLPAQSGSDRVLKRMLRRYRRADYIEAVSALKQVRPDIAITTDLIVGFPGETTADFEETLSLIAEVAFASAFSFKFSPRPGTAALNLGDEVAPAEKARRLAVLQALQSSVTRRTLDAQIGARVEVLVEGPSVLSRRSGARQAQWTGRTRRNEAVNFETEPGRDVRAGALVQVEIIGAGPHSLKGRPVASA